MAAAGAKMLLDKVAVITGGASGIGAATARLFASHGAKVVVADVQDKLGEQLCRDIGSGSQYVHCDVRSEPQVESAVAVAMSRHSKLDVMFNCAGIVDLTTCRNPIMDLDATAFDHVCGVNVRGTLFGVKHAARAMVKGDGDRSIVNMSSIAAIISQKGASLHSYTISKHAVVGITKSVAAELCDHGIRVNCVSPSAAPTPMCASFFGKNCRREELEEFLAAGSDLRGVPPLSAEDVANAVLFLSCPQGRYISGHNLVLDGCFSTARHCL